jgi:hypothetical protein
MANIEKPNAKVSQISVPTVLEIRSSVADIT